MAAVNRKLKGLGEMVLKEAGIDMTLTVYESGMQSYSTLGSPTEGVIYLGTDFLKMDNPDKNTYQLRLMGHFYHELAHLIFTQFEPMGEYRRLEKLTQAAVPAFADDKKDLLLAGDPDTIDELTELFKAHIRAKKGAELLNMLEDAAIEVRIPGVGTSERRKHKILAAISAARNYSWSLEKESCENGDKIVKSNPAEFLNRVLWEIHQLGVIGYRRNIRTPLLDRMDECEDIKDYIQWSKFSSKNTKERQTVVEILMDILNPTIQQKAEAFANEFLRVLAMDPSQMEEAMDGMSEDMEAELSISVPNMTASGSHTNQKSEYDFRLSDEQEQKRQEKEKESGNDSDSNDSGDGSESEGSDGESGDSNEGSEGSSSDSEGSESNSDETSGNTGSDTDEKGEESSSEPGESSDSENTEDDNSSSGNKSESGQEGEDNSNPSGTPDGDSQNNSSSKHSSDGSNKPGKPGKTLPSKKDLQKEAEEAIEESMKEAEALDAKKEEKAEKSKAQSSTKEFSPTRMEDNEFHKGIDTEFVDHKQRYPWKPYPEDWCMKLMKKTSTAINKIVMYASQDQVAKGLTSGKLSRKNLYRAATDYKVFERKTPGKKNQLRIALLIDQSGSMYGKRIMEAKKTAWIFASACLRAHIPVSVWGHQTGRYSPPSILLHRYFGWNDNYRQLAAIGEAEEGGANQDGLAIYQVARDLVANQKPGEHLVLIVLSDGLPSGYNGYDGIEAERDVTNICNMFKKHFGVETIGMGIEMRGRDADGIRRIYGDNAVLVEHSSELPLQTVELLKKLCK